MFSIWWFYNKYIVFRNAGDRWIAWTCLHVLRLVIAFAELVKLLWSKYVISIYLRYSKPFRQLTGQGLIAAVRLLTALTHLDLSNLLHTVTNSVIEPIVAHLGTKLQSLKIRLCSKVSGTTADWLLPRFLLIHPS